MWYLNRDIGVHVCYKFKEFQFDNCVAAIKVPAAEQKYLLLQSNMLSWMCWGKRFFFELSIIRLISQWQIGGTLQNILQLRFFVCLFVYLVFFYWTTFSLKTDGSLHWYFSPLSVAYDAIAVEEVKLQFVLVSNVSFLFSFPKVTLSIMQ